MHKRRDPIATLATAGIAIFLTCAGMAACAAGQMHNLLDPVPPSHAQPVTK